MLLEMDREIRTRVAQDLALTTSDKRNLLHPIRTFSVMDDMKQFEFILFKVCLNSVRAIQCHG